MCRPTKPHHDSLTFPHLNSNIEAQIGLIVLLCHDEVFEVDVFCLCFGIFSFVAMKMASQKLSLIQLKFGVHF